MVSGVGGEEVVDVEEEEWRVLREMVGEGTGIGQAQRRDDDVGSSRA